MITNPETITAPAWQDRRVVWFQGFHDSLLAIENATGEKLSSDDRKRLKDEARVRAEEAGECYRSISLRDIFNFQPTAKAKMDGPAFVPSCYDNFDAREHSAQRDHGQFVALTGDIDKGDIDAAAVTKAVALFAPGAACLIYSSPHSRPGEKRWRVFLPLAEPANFYTWHDAQLAFYQFMEARGIAMDHALARAAQPVFLPNVPERHEKSGTDLRGPDGKPLYYKALRTKDTLPGLDLTTGIVASGIAAIRADRLADEQKREAIRKVAEQRRASTPRGDGASLIDDFNAANSVASMLEMCGYEQSLRSADDWKSALQSGDTFATRVMGSKWCSLSQSDADAGLGEKHGMGCYGDAYDLFVHYKHGGDHKSAYRQLGAEKRAAGGNVIYPAKFEAVPDWMSETPLPDEMPDWVQDAEFDIDPDDFAPVGGIDEGDSDTFELLDIDELENLPPPQWLVKELVVEDGLTILYGDPGSGKSFIGLDMALRLTLGMDWHGFDTRQTGVLYIAGEGARGLGKRVKGWRREHKTESINSPFLLLPVPVALLEPDQRAKLLRTITEAKRRADFDIGLVVIDTVSRSLAGAGENGADEMGAFVAACDIIRMYTGGAVLGIHHSGKDKDKGMRGSSVLLGACDGTIRVEKSEDIVTIKTEKQKDAEEAAPLYMSMKKVSWPAPDGEQTTLVPYRTESTRDAGLSREWIAQAFSMMADAWGAKRPLSHRSQTQRDGRYAPAIFARKLGGEADIWARHIALWLENGCLSIEVADKHSKAAGLRVLEAIF